MSQKLSIQEYYYQQKRIAETYDVNDHHAGCYISHYPDERVCARCAHLKKCIEIWNKDRNNGHA